MRLINNLFHATRSREQTKGACGVCVCMYGFPTMFQHGRRTRRRKEEREEKRSDSTIGTGDGECVRIAALFLGNCRIPIHGCDMPIKIQHFLSIFFFRWMNVNVIRGNQLKRKKICFFKPALVRHSCSKQRWLDHLHKSAIHHLRTIRLPCTLLCLRDGLLFEC